MEIKLEGKGIVKILPELCEYLREWYLVDEGDLLHETRKYVDENWFYDKLKDNEEGICILACLYNDDLIEVPESLRPEIKKWEDAFKAETSGYGMDTFIYMEEVFMQKATNEPNLHWW